MVISTTRRKGCQHFNFRSAHGHLCRALPLFFPQQTGYQRDQRVGNTGTEKTAWTATGADLSREALLIRLLILPDPAIASTACVVEGLVSPLCSFDLYLETGCFLAADFCRIFH